MAIADRTAFKEYCLRRLGDGVIEINVSDAQVEDRIDDAIQMWQEMHNDGFEEVYVTHVLTQTDVDNGYITVPDDIMLVHGVFGISDPMLSRSLLDINYQIKLTMIQELQMMGGMQSYIQTRQYLNMMDDLLNGEVSWRYHRYGKRLYIDGTDTGELKAGEYVALKAYVRVDPATSTAWDNIWLKAYATALIQLQWGQNLAKFEGVIMLGGVTMNAGGILDQAQNEIAKLEEELQTKWSDPVDFYVG